MDLATFSYGFSKTTLYFSNPVPMNFHYVQIFLFPLTDLLDLICLADFFFSKI